jgi:hypothetical protein
MVTFLSVKTSTGPPFLSPFLGFFSSSLLEEVIAFKSIFSKSAYYFAPLHTASISAPV